MTALRLLLIRHGQTPANVLGELDTARPGPGLTELGRQQAHAVPAAARAEKIAALSASVLLRTQLTAAPLAAARGLQVTVRPGLEEIGAGELEKASDPASVHRYLETVFAWGRGELDPRMPGGDDGHAFFARYDAAIAAIAQEAAALGATTAALVSHGAAIRVWAAHRGANLDPEYARTHPLDNTGVVIVEGSPDDGWHVVSWAGEPIGGAAVRDTAAPDPMGEGR